MGFEIHHGVRIAAWGSECIMGLEIHNGVRNASRGGHKRRRVCVICWFTDAAREALKAVLMCMLLQGNASESEELKGWGRYPFVTCVCM